MKATYSALVRTAVIASVFCACLQAPVARAIPFTTDLSVTGTLTFDTAFADPSSPTSSVYAISGTGVVQTGSMAVFAGGVMNSSSYSGFTVSGSNPRSATLTDLSDGIQIRQAFAATAPLVGNGTFAVGIGSPSDPTQMSISVHNNSATTGYRLLFRYGVSNLINALGTDAFAHSQFSLSANGVEIKFSDLTSDTVNGNAKNGAAAPGAGGAVNDSQNAILGFDLLAGGDLNLHGFWTLEGGGFVAGSGAGAFFDMSLFLERVTPLDQPPPPSVPVPGTLLLLGLGLLALARVRQKSH